MTVPLNLLPPPDAVAGEEFRALRDAALERLQVLAPSYVVRVTDPAVRLVEIAAYLRLLLGARINDAVRATFLATARRADLDHVAAGMNVGRKAGESDDDLRLRAQLAWTAVSTAGPRDAYRFHALGVAGVAGVAVTSPKPGEVSVAVLSTDADGVAGADLLAAVTAALNADAVRPVTDEVDVISVATRAVPVAATLRVSGQGPDTAVVQAAAEAAVGVYLAARVIGRDVYRSALIDACHAAGVDSVVLAAPAADVAIGAAEVAIAGDVALTVART